MSEAPNGLRGLLGDGAIGKSQHRILQSLDDRAADLANALRRAVPILMRKGVSFVAEPTVLEKSSDALARLGAPYFHVPLATDPGGSRAMLVLEIGAINYLLNAAFGGNAEDDSGLCSTEL